ncbi:hypothetical protein B9Z55_001974 [Caenorhabditis nigoni]|uniref:Presenilin n=1 Tax=Caenorhabditis nigoni TaxID=1611254 RepID=A0A2G5VI97_9PELO|nr:hypothetical protein B9Z55_001974 [Caenorhabditis nigoni]
MIFLVLTTTMGVVCYKKRLYKAITAYIIANSVSLLLVYAFFHFHNLAQACSIPMSVPSSVFLTFQFGGLGVLSLHWKAHRRLHQFYLVMLAALTALFLLKNLPDWTVWISIVAISIWDIVAVLTPCGPLKMLVETASRRGDNNFPAILYNWEVREVEGTIRLGMGDFVFYSLMLGNAAQTSPLTTVLACFLSNLVGLTITLPVVSLSQTALPALPFPLLIAALFYFSSHVALTPFTNLCSLTLILF